MQSRGFSFLPNMTPELDKRRADALDFVRRRHGGLPERSDGPAWRHLDRVSRLLEAVLGDAGEGSADERAEIAVAALGHDTLEDTPTTADELAAVFGPRGVALIEGMTNRFGDDHPAPYVKQVAGAEEAVRLIKLADLFDNCSGVTYNIGRLGSKWAESYFLPIVEPMIAAVTETGFAVYPRTAARLKDMVRTVRVLLLDAVAKQKAAEAGPR